MLRVSLVQTHTPPPPVFINLFSELYCFTWGIIRTPKKMLNFPLGTKLFRGRGEVIRVIVCSFRAVLLSKHFSK